MHLSLVQDPISEACGPNAWPPKLSVVSPLPSARVPVGEHLADQLLLPMAIAHGGRMLTVNPTLHTTTNAEVISQFLPIRFAMSLLDGQRWEIVVRCA